MSASHDHLATRQFALEVVERLRSAGFAALWAGGCVRDQLLGHEPKDYDVATSARPDEVRRVFGFRRTVAVGAAFGVITVLGPHGALPVEVATFRQDDGYSDGRHPDRVTFSNAEADAQRRDFTINGLFYDPLAERVIDYVGGQEDLKSGIIRAIGDPRARFDEDKLRMVRAIRFATTFGFQLDDPTLQAIRELAREVVIVSAERIAAEMRRLLPQARRRRGVELLRSASLLPVLLPEVERIDPESLDDHSQPPGSDWMTMLATLDALHLPTFPVALAALIRPLCIDQPDLAVTICQRWRLSNDETHRVDWLLRNEAAVRQAPQLPWPRVQRILAADGAAELLTLSAGLAHVFDADERAIEFCREQLARPAEQFNPPALLNGNDLKAAGLRPGPQFRELLEQLRDAQLLGELSTRDAALAWVRERAAL